MITSGCTFSNTESTSEVEPVDTPERGFTIFPHMFLHRDTVNTLYSVAEHKIKREDDTEVLHFVCIIAEAEGPVCFLEEKLEDGKIGDAEVMDKDLAVRIVLEELGWKWVERARELRVRCRRSVEDHQLIECNFYRWGEWEPLPVYSD
jgi:hypothetical protein